MNKLTVTKQKKEEPICSTEKLNLFLINTDIVQGDSLLINEYTCVLCLNVVSKPLLIECCDRLFCFTCAFAFLQNDSKCPFCKQQESKFISPNKMILRILNNLRISCPLSGLFMRYIPDNEIEMFENMTILENPRKLTNEDKNYVSAKNIRVKQKTSLNSIANNPFTNKPQYEILECKEYICHQSYLEHLLNKCPIKMYLNSCFESNAEPIINEKNCLKNMICCNTENKHYNNILQNSKSKYKGTKFQSFAIYAELIKNFMFCTKCECPDFKETHKCEQLQVVCVKNSKQNALLKYLTRKGESKINKKEPIVTLLHQHPVIFTNFRDHDTVFSPSHSWSCDFCLKSQYIPITVHSYNCKECDIDICADCFSLTKLRKPNTSVHTHSLKIREDGFSWFCDLCEFNYGSRISFCCEECDFDVCLNCYYK